MSEYNGVPLSAWQARLALYTGWLQEDRPNLDKDKLRRKIAHCNRAISIIKLGELEMAQEIFRNNETLCNQQNRYEAGMCWSTAAMIIDMAIKGDKEALYCTVESTRETVRKIGEIPTMCSMHACPNNRNMRCTGSEGMAGCPFNE